jgi:hypothetical protein
MDPKIFNEVDSLKIEIASLHTQLLKEEERIVAFQQKIVDLARENHQLREAILKADNSKLFDELGIKGKIVKLLKQEDNRYKLESETE